MTDGMTNMVTHTMFSSSVFYESMMAQKLIISLVVTEPPNEIDDVPNNPSVASQLTIHNPTRFFPRKLHHF
jgi:hypothetical protein